MDLVQIIFGGILASIAWFIVGGILVGVKIIPRLFDMYLQSTYPNKLLTIEFINGVIGSFIMASVLVLTI